MEKLSWREPMKRIASPADILTVVIAIGVGVAVRAVLPYPVLKVAIALAGVTAVAVVAVKAYRRYVSPEPPVEAEETTTS